MTIVEVATATTQAQGQEPLADTWSSGRQQEICRRLTLIPDRTDVGIMLQGAPIEIAQWSPEPEPYVTSGLRDYAPETEQIATDDIFVSFSSKDTDLLNCQLILEFFDGLSAAYTVAPLSPPRTIVLDERSQRTGAMEKMLRSFSELPENWDSYGCSAISLDAINEARRILRAAIILKLPDPWVAPGGDAGIGIQWDTDRAELYIDVIPEEETTYVLTPKAGNVGEADGVLTMGNLSEVLNQLAESAT